MLTVFLHCTKLTRTCMLQGQAGHLWHTGQQVRPAWQSYAAEAETLACSLAWQEAHRKRVTQPRRLACGCSPLTEAPECRAARQCHSVAHGGQIMVALDAAQDFIAHWTSLEHVPLDEEGAASARYLTAGPAGDRAPETQAINNLLYSPHATLQQHAEQARAIARSISRAPGAALPVA